MEKLAERTLKAAVPTMWLTRGREALAIVKFPHKTEPGEWWAERLWIATTWIFTNGLFGVEVIFEDTRLTAIACPQYSEGLVNVQEVRILLNTKPVVSLRLHEGAVQLLNWWAHKAKEKIDVERARHTELCSLWWSSNN